MKVNFNNLRKKSFYAVQSVSDILSENITEDGRIEIEAYEIEDAINEALQTTFATLCVYKEGDEDFQDLSEDININWFNNEE